jgi:hypothetical protein
MARAQALFDAQDYAGAIDLATQVGFSAGTLTLLMLLLLYLRCRCCTHTLTLLLMYSHTFARAAVLTHSCCYYCTHTLTILFACSRPPITNCSRGLHVNVRSFDLLFPPI